MSREIEETDRGEISKAVGAAAVVGGEVLPGSVVAQEISSIRITRISSFSVDAPRWKNIGCNSHKGVHGKTARDRVVRIETSAGIEGVGSCSSPRRAAAQIVGKDPLSFFKPGFGMVSPLDRGDAPLWDLVARIHEQPAWRLFGGYGPEKVTIYDGSIYFADLLPEHEARGVSRILDEVDHALDRGHRAFKIKVGRGFKWMEKKAGFARDVEVVRKIRAHVGNDVRLGVDANNGYDLATTLHFLEEVDEDLWFVEEMFPENVEQILELKAFLRKKGWKTLIADGESARDEEHFVPYIERQAMDVLQGDVRSFGFTRLLRLARMTASKGVFLAPHNWGSFLGLYMQVVLGRGVPNLLMAEQDPGVTDIFRTEGFDLKDGSMSVPDKPGLGLELDARSLEKSGVQVDWSVSS